MEFRLLDEHWRPAVMSLWDYCFEQRGDPFFEWYFSRYCRLPQVMGAVQAGQLKAMAHLNPYQIRLRGNAVPAAYFVGVATAPEARGQGLFRPLLAAALAELRRQGHGVTLLMPSAASFYRPYGFAYCYHQWQFDCSVDQLGQLVKRRPSMSWRPATLQDDPALARVYAKAMRHRHAYVVRTSDSWQTMLAALFAEGGAAFLAFDESNEPVASLWFTRQNRRLQVVELLAADATALDACLGLLHQHRSQAEQVSFRLPSDDLFYDRVPDAAWSIQLKPFMMGRIVDVERALRQCLPPAQQLAGASLTLEVSDPLAAWNSGVWRIAYEPALSIYRTADHTPEIKISVDALAQLCFGYYSAAQLQSKAVLTGEPAALRRLSDWLPPCENFINEFY